MLVSRQGQPNFSDEVFNRNEWLMKEVCKPCIFRILPHTKNDKRVHHSTFTSLNSVHQLRLISTQPKFLGVTSAQWSKQKFIHWSNDNEFAYNFAKNSLYLCPRQFINEKQYHPSQRWVDKGSSFPKLPPN